MVTFKWEQLKDNLTHSSTFRMKVPGGWLVKTGPWREPGAALSITFYPDPDHLWKGE
jgi:hypothetical protein